MTTLAELCLQPPAPTHGKPLQFEYGVGDMMLAFEVADISAGASIEWHDLSQFFEMARWRVGAEQAYGKYRDGNPVVLLRRRFTDGVSDFDALAPWYEDTSAVFGSHVRLRGGLIARLGIFRVADGVTDKWFPLFTSRVKRWSDGARAMGNNRYHQITCMGMQSRLARKPLSSRLPEGWRPRLDADLTQAAWNLPVEVYGAETEDDGGGAVPTVKLAARPALPSAIQALDSTLDPVGLTWRILPNGTLLVEPAPWTTFHADKFADAGLTVTGAARLNPLLGIYPGGRVTFSWSPADEPGQVGFYNYPTDGDGFGIDSDVENVVNEWQITYPLDVDDANAGTDSRNYQDPVSADEFDPAPMQAATWLARNDQVQDDTVDFRAHADLVTPPLLTSIDAPGAFPALAVLGQYDPITVVNATREDRTQVSADGIIRSITHEMRAGKLGTGVTWKAWVQPDLQSSEQTPLLKPVNALQVTDIREDGATFSWVDPSQAIAPTETQVRMNSGAWLSIAYPAGGFDWFTGLAPKTLHKFEVRLVRKVDDLTTHVSPVREVSFTTLEVTVPTVPPGGDGTVVVVPPPDEDCDAVWELLRSSDGIVYELVASGDKDDFTYDEETDTWLLDNSDYTFEEGYTYRRRVREICGGVPGDWVYETPTSIVCEDPAQLGSAPYDDASLKVFVPKICGTKVLEAVTGVEGTKGPAFGGIGLDNAGNYALKSATGVGGIVAYGAAGIAELTGDLSKAITVNLGTVPASGSPVALWQCAGLHIEAHYVSASTWRVRAKIFLASGGSITTTFSGALNLDTEYEIKVTHDVDSQEVKVFVDGVEECNGTVGTRINALPVWIMALPADSYATSAAVWNSTSVVSSVRFDYVSDAAQSWTVPSGVTSIVVEAAGAQGGDVGGGPGLGGKVIATFSVTPGDKFDVYAAAQGSRSGGVAGGWPGGGDGRNVSGTSDGGGGGGYSALVPFGSALASALVVAGGGGGGGATSSNAGGDGGHPTGSAGSPTGGAGGTQGAGGAGHGAGQSGSAGQGGDALGGTSAFDEGGGGGGAGWYGGGGGQSSGSGGSSGGGGSGYVAASGSDSAVENGSNAGDGYVLISWSTPIAGGGGVGGNALATGGTVTIDTPTLVEHQFTSPGSDSFALDASGDLDVDYLVAGAGGGGSGGTSGSHYGGAGAGGTVRSGSTTVSSTQSVTVGAGGAGKAASGVDGDSGGSSSFGAVTAVGGSGGGANGDGGDNADYSGEAGSGLEAGGGAGAAEAGGTNSAGDGGDGVEWPASSGEYYGGGGGAPTSAGSVDNPGGAGGGGASNKVAGGEDGTDGRGGGGGSAGSSGGGDGGDGIVIVRYNPSTGWTPA